MLRNGYLDLLQGHAFSVYGISSLKDHRELALADFLLELEVAQSIVMGSNCHRLMACHHSKLRKRGKGVRVNTVLLCVSSLGGFT